MSGTNSLQAQCLPNTTQTNTFNSYIQTCRTSSDTVRANNLFSPAISQFKDTFAQLRGEFDNLIITGDNAAVIGNLTGTSVSEVNKQISDLTKKKDMMIAEVKALQSQVEASDRTFLDNIMNGPVEKELAPSLQDVSLLLFWFGWLVIFVTIVMIRWISPGGGWRPGVFTFVLMTLVTLCMYALIMQVA